MPKPTSPLPDSPLWGARKTRQDLWALDRIPISVVLQELPPLQAPSVATDTIGDPASKVPDLLLSDIAGWYLKSRKNFVFDGACGVLLLHLPDALHISRAFPNVSTLIGRRIRSDFVASVVAGYKVPSEIIYHSFFVWNQVERMYVQRMNIFLLGDSNDLPVVSPSCCLASHLILRNFSDDRVTTSYAHSSSMYYL